MKPAHKERRLMRYPIPENFIDNTEYGFQPIYKE